MPGRGILLPSALLVVACVAAGCGAPAPEMSASASISPSDEASSPSTASANVAAPSPSTGDCSAATLAIPQGPSVRFAGLYAAQGEPCPAVAPVKSEDPFADVAAGRVDLAVGNVADGLAARESGVDLVNVAQIFQRSPSVEVSHAAAGITTAADFADHRIGLSRSSSRYEAIAAAQVAGLDPVADVEFVTTDDVAALQSGTVDAVQTTTYGGLPQLQATLGKDLTIVSYADQGVGMLADGIWARGNDLKTDAAYRDRVQSAVTATLEGWITCRDHIDACLTRLPDDGDAAGLTAVNLLIWPSHAGIGSVDPTAWDLTINVAHNTKDLDGAQLLANDVSPDARTDEFSTAAIASLRAAGLDTTG